MKKTGQKKFFERCTVCAPGWKHTTKKIFFFKIFFAFYYHYTSDNMHAKFRQNWTIFNFHLFFRVHSALIQLKIKNCPILTKFGVHIVWSKVIMKSRKILKKIIFLGCVFILERAQCTAQKNFFAQFFSNNLKCLSSKEFWNRSNKVESRFT